MILDPTDQNIRDQGFNFVPFDRFLAAPFQPKTLDMSGGISTLPVTGMPSMIRPPNEGGDGSGGPPPDDDEDEDAYSDSPYDKYGNLKGTMSPISALKNTFAFMTNPLGYMGYNAYKEFQRARQQKQFEKELQNADFRDMVAENRAGRTGGYQAGYGSDFMDGPSDAGRGNNPGDKGGSDSMGSFMNGGIVDLVGIYD